MTPQFSPHAQLLFQDILLAIEEKLSYEDAVRWHDKIIGDIAQLEHYPYWVADKITHDMLYYST